MDVLTLIAHAAIYLEVRGAQLEFELEVHGQGRA